LEGTLIGDGRAFVDHIRERYNKTLTITKENQKNRAKLNVDENEEKMRKKKEGDTLGVKITNHLERMKKKGVSQLIEDTFYSQDVEEGIPFYSRRTNLLRDMKVMKDDTVINVNKTINIPDEMLQR
jgi:predicted nuclease of restriction endonuclease-like RecB superfamily